MNHIGYIQTKSVLNGLRSVRKSVFSDFPGVVLRLTWRTRLTRSRQFSVLHLQVTLMILDAPWISHFGPDRFLESIWPSPYTDPIRSHRSSPMLLVSGGGVARLDLSPSPQQFMKFRPLLIKICTNTLLI